MKDYNEEIDILFDMIKNSVRIENAFELEKQNFKNWLEQILADTYQEGINEGIDRSTF